MNKDMKTIWIIPVVWYEVSYARNAELEVVIIMC